MKYLLWIDSKQSGPYEAAEIIKMLDSYSISSDTLARREGDAGDWTQIRRYYSEIFEPQESQTSPASPKQPSRRAVDLPKIEDSRVSLALTIVALLEFIGAPIVGLAVGSDNAFEGWVVFVSGVISGLVLLGFSRVIQNTFESSQRLRRLEILMERSCDDK